MVRQIKWLMFLCLTLCFVGSCGAITTSCVECSASCGTDSNYDGELFPSLISERFSISTVDSSGIAIDPDTYYIGVIPCSYTCPAMGDTDYIISLTQKSRVTISVGDCCIPGDRYNVYIDGTLIGMTSEVDCGGYGSLGSGTFTVLLDPGDHTLQFANTCTPCFTGDPPCYGVWLSSGFSFQYSTEIVDGENPAIKVIKTADMPIIYKDEEVTYTYTVTNVGDVPLTDVIVTDSQGLQVELISGDENGDLKLDLTETWIFKGKATLREDTTNTATVSAKFEGLPVTADSDPVTVYVIDPKISIAKSVDHDIVYVGASVTYTYEVTNTGTGDLSDIEVTDDQTGVIPAFTSGDDGDGMLENGEKWVYMATVTLSDTVTNIGTASGTDELGKTVTAKSEKITVLVLVPVKVDIKPGSCPNAFNRQDKGVLPVAIVGTADFDVKTIDTTKTITLNGIRATKWEIRDTATPYSYTDACGCHVLGSDGVPDLIVYFPVKSIATAIPGNAVIKDVISLNLGGTLKDGRTIDGNDCIMIVK